MPGAATTPPGRRKVRCPNCTALLKEPPSPVFECPICSTLLSAKRISGESKSVSSNENGKDAENTQQTNEEMEKAINGSDEPSRTQGQHQPMDYERKEITSINGNDRAQEQQPMVDTRKEGASLVENNREQEQQPLNESTSVDDNDRTQGQPSADYTSKESLAIDGNDGMLGQQNPMDYVNKEGISFNGSGKTQEELPMDYVNKQATLMNGDDRIVAQLPMDYAANESTSSVRREDRSTADQDEGAEGQDHEERDSLVDGNSWSLQSQILRDTLYDLSFKYSLEGISSDDQPLYRKRSHRPKTVPAETSMPKTDASDMPSYTSLRVRLSHSHGESSDQSEHESYSSGFESMSHDGSESDFDFPAPLSESLQAIKLPASFGQTKKLYPDSDCVVSASPNQLEMQDLDVIDHGKSTLQEPSGHIEGPQLELPSQIGDGGKIAFDVKRGLDLGEMTLLDGSRQRLHGADVGDVFAGGEEKEINRNQGTPFHQVKESNVKEESMNANILSSPIEASMGSSSGGGEDATFLTFQEDTELKQSKTGRLVPDVRNVSMTNVHHSSATRVQDIERKRGLSSWSENKEKNGPPERLQLYDREGKLHDRFIPQVQRSRNGEGLYMAGSDRNTKGSTATQERYVPPASGLVDRQGHNPLLQNQSRQADLHVAEQSPSRFSHHPVSNFFSFSPASSQPYAYTNHHIVSDPFGLEVPSANRTYPYQVPSHPLVHPVAMQGRAVTHCGYHVSPVCMLCVHRQHSHVPQPQIAPCALCFSQSVSMAHQPGHGDCWNCDHAHHAQGSVYASSPVGCSQTCFSSKLAQRYETSIVELKSQASPVRKHKHYPPLPQGGAAPYVICNDCNRILQVPAYLPPNDVMTQKLRCGGCGKVSKFSVYNDIQQTCIVSLQSPAVESMVGASSMSPLVQSNKHSRQLPVSKVTQSMESSYHQGLVSLSPRLHMPYEQGPLEISFSRSVVESQKNEALRVGKLGFEGSKMSDGLPLQSTVDEKEEGLDFGAPRVSDGDSLDHSESRMRSPENKQGYHQENYGEVSGKEPLRGHQAAWTTESRQQQVFESNQSTEHGTAQEKKPGSPLITLFNQESTRFKISLPERASYEDSRSALWSPASGLPPYDHPTYERPYEREQGISQSHGPSAQHFVSRGPRYIAGLLRRSLKDFGRGQ